MKEPRTVLFVIAPDIPCSEVKVLESHIMEALSDPDYTVITNYDVRWESITINPGDTVNLIAPMLPPLEIAALREKFDTKDVIVVNYDVMVSVIPSEDLQPVRDAVRKQRIETLRQQASDLGFNLISKETE